MTKLTDCSYTHDSSEDEVNNINTYIPTGNTLNDFNSQESTTGDVETTTAKTVESTFSKTKHKVSSSRNNLQVGYHTRNSNKPISSNIPKQKGDKRNNNESDVSYSSSTIESRKSSNSNQKETTRTISTQTNEETFTFKHASRITTQSGNPRDKPWYEAAATQFQQNMRSSINPVSFEGRKTLTSKWNSTADKNGNDITPLEVDIDPFLYCEHCKQLNTHCHKRCYKDYILKKLFFMYSNKTEQPTLEQIKAEVFIAYNERRKVMDHEKFGFYDGVDWELPKCIKDYCTEIAKLIKEVVVATRINNETREGNVQMLRAKRFRKM